MNCIYCGQFVGRESKCPFCGHDLSALQKAVQISEYYYNEGLDKAQIRDLSGAIDCLQRALRFDKSNIHARNLLGLVWLETGEVVSALSEWVISKNLHAEDNIAAELLEKVQSNQDRLKTIQQSIKRYNRAIDIARDGQEDIAIMMLKKVLAANPKLIKAYHLLALLYMKRGEYERARRVLKRAIPVDRTNSTTLRFIREIDEQTGTATNLRGEKNGYPETEAGTYRVFDDDDETESEVRPRRKIKAKEKGFFATRLSSLSPFTNLLIGIVIGVLVIAFLVLPTVSRSANREADVRISEYSEKNAELSDRIEELEGTIQQTENSVTDANNQIQETQKQTEAYEKLFQALNNYSSQNYNEAQAILAEINVELLSADALVVYNNLVREINDQLFSRYSAEGIAQFERGNYPAAIEALEKARQIKDDDYNVLSYLGHAYRMNGQGDEAIEVFKTIINKFPNTHKAEAAQLYITAIESGNFGEPEVAVPQTEEQPAEQTAEQPADQTEEQQQPEEGGEEQPENPEETPTEEGGGETPQEEQPAPEEQAAE